MKDEIKEILEGIKVVIKHDGTLEFDAKELKILLDYITNLQEENEMYKGSFETMSKNYFEEKSRNKKAIECIKDNLTREWGEYLYGYEDLLNILNGGYEDGNN